MNEGVILLVESNEHFDELTQAPARQRGVTNEVVAARNGVAAIDYLFDPEREAQEMACLVLLDLHMPRKDSFEMLRKMRIEERTRLVPVVMLTSSDHPDDVRTAYEEGANAYLDKVSKRVSWPEQVITIWADLACFA